MEQEGTDRRDKCLDQMRLICQGVIVPVDGARSVGDHLHWGHRQAGGKQLKGRMRQNGNISDSDMIQDGKLMVTGWTY